MVFGNGAGEGQNPPQTAQEAVWGPGPLNGLSALHCGGVLEHEDTCPHMHVQTLMSTHKLLHSAALHTRGC